jgi:hypothetical protein
VPETCNQLPPCNMLFRRTVVPGQRGGQDRCDIGHPRVVGGAPFQRQVRTELCPEQRLNLRTGAISKREKASPARPAQRRNTPTCGNGSVARYKVIHAAAWMITNRRFR